MIQDHVGARQEYQWALQSARRRSYHRGEVDVLGGLAILAVQQGQPEEAKQRLTEAIEVSERIGYRRGEAVNSLNLASIFYMSLQSVGSLPHYNAAMESFLSLNDQRGLAMVRANRSQVIHETFGSPEAYESAQMALDYFTGEGDERHQAMTLDTLAAIDLVHGRKTASRKRLKRALHLVQQAGDDWLQAQIRQSFGQVELSAGRHRAALDHLAEGLAIAKEHDFAPLTPNLLALQAQVLLAAGDPEHARSVAHQAAGFLDDNTAVPHRCALRLAEVLEAVGQNDEAAPLAERANAWLQRNLDGLEQSAQADALANVAENVRVVELYRRHFPVEVTVRLPRLGATLGRALRDAEYVDVRWTVFDPQDHLAGSKTDCRQRRILRLLTQAADAGAECRVTDLATAVTASAATINRDLRMLRDDGYMVDTRGSK